MKVSHLVVAGCSWTYCQGLESPQTQGWPALVGKALGIPVVNLALPGLGNDAIHRRTYEYAFEDHGTNPLYIICWTQLWRREAWCRKLYNPKSVDGYNIISFPDNNPQNNLEKALLDTWSEEDFYRRLMLYNLSITSLFKLKNIPYYTSFFSDDIYEANRSIVQDIKDRLKKTDEYLVTNVNRLLDFHQIADKYPKTRCGHEGIEGNIAISNYLINMLKHVVPVNTSYLTLKEYEKRTDPCGAHFSVWI